MENVVFWHVNSNMEVGLVAIKDYALVKKIPHEIRCAEN